MEIAKKKVGPATGLASDVATLLELLKPHLNSLSTNASDIVATMEGDVKVAGMQDEKSKEDTNCEKPPAIQLTQLDIPVTDAQEMASQIQAREAMKKAEEEEEEKSEESKNRCGKESEEQFSHGEPEHCSQQHQRPKAGNPDEYCRILTILSSHLQGHCKNQREVERQGRS